MSSASAIAVRCDVRSFAVPCPETAKYSFTLPLDAQEKLLASSFTTSLREVVHPRAHRLHARIDTERLLFGNHTILSNDRIVVTCHNFPVTYPVK